MQSSGTVPEGGVAVNDIPGLADALAHPGPFASVYLNTEGAVEDAPQRLGIRWKNIRRHLAERGAPERVLSAIDPVVDGAHVAGEMLVVLATSEGVVLARHEPALPDREVGSWGALPRLAPLLSAHQAAIPHVVVLTDRIGADMVAYRRDHDDIERTLDGRDLHVTRSAPGGWSQRRFQQRAENVWETNASDVADALVRLADDTGASAVVVAGDVRAVQLLLQALPVRVSQLVTTVDGSRAAGAADAVAGHVEAVLDGLVEDRSAALLATFAEELGQGDRAADGPEPTFDALAHAQVHTLLVHDDPGDRRTAWWSPSPTDVALHKATLGAMGVDDPHEARLVDVAVRAALGTGGAVRVVPTPAGLTGGIGAILRYTLR